MIYPPGSRTIRVGRTGRAEGFRKEWAVRKWVALLTVLLCASAAFGIVRDDAFLAGYVTAVIERELGVEGVEVRLEGGRAVVQIHADGQTSPERIAAVVAGIEGIEQVSVRVVGEPGEAAHAQADEAGEGDDVRFELLPREEIFGPLLADPREPHFSATYQWYLDDDELTHVGSANFGETFPLLGGKTGETSWQLGLLGGVFSVFDLDAESSDLVNSDFWVGPTLSVRNGRWSGQLRIYHQSSHLGDEFLLRNRTDRVNLSYEGVDLILSGDLHRALRVYAGGGVLVHTEPELHPLSVQGGIELRSPIAFLEDMVRPVAAFDIQAREENGWQEDIGAVAGIELFNPKEGGLRLMILGSYFHGNSPNGQFYERRVEYLGVGTHLFF